MDKYLQYDHLELSEDPSFIRWAKGSESSDSQDWDAWLTSHPEKAEMVADAKSIVLAMKFVADLPKEGIEEKVWSKISLDVNKEKSSSKEGKPNRNLYLKFLPYAAIAAIALILLIMNMGNDFDTSLQTSFAMIENITLPDGSEVMVNADSKVQYDAKSWDENRIISLDGEAFFTVKKGSKFTVKTTEGSVQVLGTSFNVYNRDKKLNVYCETGKVSVKSAGKETIIIPRQSVSVINREHHFSENVAETDRRSTWKEGIYVYKGSPLSEVMAEIERQFDVKISMDKSLREIKYTGSFNKSNINTALTEICYPLELKFYINAKNIIVTR